MDIHTFDSMPSSPRVGSHIRSVTFAVAFLLLFANTSAATAEDSEALVTAPAAHTPTQTFFVSPVAFQQPVVHEAFGATSQAELDQRAASAAQASAAAARVASIAPPQGGYSGEAIVAYAKQFVGNVRYSMGATPAAGFSCDGLTQYVFAQFGVSLPRMVGPQTAAGTVVSRADARAGDLVIWGGSHLGIYDGNGGVVHSPAPGRMVEHSRTLWGNPFFVRI
jgi:cell wall-associated NlpC family hydrolase